MIPDLPHPSCVSRQLRSASAELECRISEAESQALTAKLQLSSQVAELDLANKRAAQAEEFVSKLTAEMNLLRERRAEVRGVQVALLLLSHDLIRRA